MQSLIGLSGFVFILPRIVLIVIWLFYRWFLAYVQGLHWLILGFIFAPYTLLWYCAVHHWFGGNWNIWQIVVMIIAIYADLTATTNNVNNFFVKDK